MEILEITSFERYEKFIFELADDPLYYDPHFAYDKENLYAAPGKKDKFAFAVLEDDSIRGVFVWLIIPVEKYIEMLIGFTKSREAFSAMLLYLEREFSDYKADFVINPKNTVLCEVLKTKGAVFEVERQNMIFTGILPDISTNNIEQYTEKWKKQYCEMHRKDTYWTAERIISASDRFRALLVIEDDQVQGYLDATYSFDKNEIYDLFVKPELSYRGYESDLRAKKLLVKAIELNGSHQMTVFVSVDASEEIGLYTAVGFEKAEGQNSLYASYKL